MTLLLDQFSPKTLSFQPTSIQDVFAVRLAQRLGDEAAVRHFVTLTGAFTQAQLLCAYRRSSRCNGVAERARRFHEELKHVNGSGSGNHDDCLIAIRIERRTVAAAVFTGQRLDYVDTRQLSSSHDKALDSAVGFIEWMLSRFQVESAAVEAILDDREIQRRVVHDAICAHLRERLLPIWEVPRQELLRGYGHPPLKKRPELRTVAEGIWPILAGGHARAYALDAAILGLHVQLERLFIINGTYS